MPTFAESFGALDKVLQGLSEVPYCSAPLPWDTTKTLFYKSNEVTESRFLNFPAADSQLESLLSACGAAPDGPIKSDVSYGKAGEVDVENFAMSFSPYDDDLVGILAETLFRNRFKAKDIKVELHKLNVYAPGGFSKAHVDSTHGASMFASLVVILPTVHEGGSVILRHGGKEWILNTAEIVGITPDVQAAFIASNSDVEREVTAVSSGFLVTLTYGLYHSKPATISKETNIDLGIKEALARLLKDPDSFPDGGFIGFGLSHKYPVDVDTTVLSDINLKGSDAAIKRACDLLSLPVSIKAAYFEDTQVVLVGKIVNIEYHFDDSLVGHLESSYGGEVAEDYEAVGREHEYPPIVWVRVQARANAFKSVYLTDHHKWPVMYADGEVCLVATVPPPDDRANFGVA